MLFNSLHFLLFFPVVTALYFALPHRFRWFLLLLASCYFYMVFWPVYILILIFTIVVDYSAGLLIASAEGPRRKLYLLLSIVANVAVLSFFKYFNFLNGSIQALLTAIDLRNPIPFLEIVLPVGLSFHVFQSLSYTIEVYRKHYPAEKHFGLFALYVMFYPQLVAGPIERPQNLLHQFHDRHYFNYARVVSGLQLMLWGFFKKVMIADRLAPFVNQVYDDPYSYTGLPPMIATLCFAFQIYCDFSGYSDVTIGAAKVMGFDLMENFRRPYFSKSIAEFWKRWHISLSTWFRDYLYISLGGNRVNEARWFSNLFFTFLISGLWHGANWTYVIWGGINGLYLIAGILTERLTGTWKARFFAGRPSAAKAFGWLQTARTFVLICVAWIVFRAKTLPEAWHILTRMFDGFSSWPQRLTDPAFLKVNILLSQDKYEVLLAILCVSALLAAEVFQERHGRIRAIVSAQPVWVRWLLYYAAVAALLFFGAFNSSQQFIYFQF